jgi:hypothetical protein
LLLNKQQNTIMKKSNLLFAVIVFTSILSISVSSCKKGSDDPVISLISREDRLTNTWTLTRYEKNGTTQDMSGSTYIYTIKNNHTATRTIEGNIFGFPTRTVTDGTWSFKNDNEDVVIILGSDTSLYNIQRLASKELWLKKTVNTDSYVYYFSGL